MTLDAIIRYIDEYMDRRRSLGELASALIEYDFSEDELSSPSAFLVSEVLAANIDREQDLPEDQARIRVLAARSQVIPFILPFEDTPVDSPDFLTWSNTSSELVFSPA